MKYVKNLIKENMKSIKKIYIVKVVKWSYNDKIMKFEEEFETFPTEYDLRMALNKCNEKYPNYKDFRTTIHVEEVYTVKNI